MFPITGAKTTPNSPLPKKLNFFPSCNTLIFSPDMSCFAFLLDSGTVHQKTECRMTEIKKTERQKTECGKTERQNSQCRIQFNVEYDLM